MRRAPKRLGILALIATVMGCIGGSGDRSRNAPETVAQHWRAIVALSVRPYPACDTVHLAEPESTCGTALHALPPDVLPALATAEATLAAEHAARPTAASAHRLGLLTLIVASDSLALDHAVALLREAARAEPAHVEYGVDLSAALLVRYADRRDLPDLFEATEVAAALTTRAAPDAAACRNYLVALAWLSVRDQLPHARARCAPECGVSTCTPPVILDDSPSADVDPRSLALEGRWTDAAWDHATAMLLPAWAQHMAMGDTARAAQVGRELRQVHDALVAQIADSSIGRALSQLERDHTVRRAMALYAEARSSRVPVGPRTARALLDSILVATDSTHELRRWVELQRANLALTGGRPREALRAYRALGARGQPHATVLEGRVAFNEGLAIMALGDQIGGLQRVEAVADRCRSRARPECALSAYAMAAGIASLVGDGHRAEQHMQRALESSIVPLRATRWSLLSVLRQAAEQYGYRATADVLHEEALQVARQLSRPDLEAQELVLRAQVRTHASDTSGLQRLLTRLETVVKQRLGEIDQQFFRADLAWIDGEYRLLTGQRGARAALESSMVQMAADTNSARQLRPRLSLARAMAAEGDTGPALQTLDALLRSLERRGGAGASLFERARLADGALAAGQVAATLLRPRADSGALLRALSAQPFLNASLPTRGGDVSRLDLAVRRLGDTVFVWSRAGEAWHFHVAQVPAPMVHDAIDGLDTSRLALLHERLVAPALAAATSAVRTIRVDARGELAALPWSALYDRRSARYLVETLAVSYTTDTWRTPDAERSMQPARVLVIDAAPRGGRRALPGAEDEVHRVRAIWGAQSAEHDGTVGAERTLARVPGFEVVHFAGHAVLDAARPERSYLELPSVSDARISGLRLATSAFPRVQLVVLAACDTRGDRTRTRDDGGAARPSRGLASLADAFREAGARQVIGAAWAIDDAATTTIMEQLHVALRAGTAPAMALRAAQLAGLRSADPARRSPRVWAAFQLLGS